MLIHAAWEVGDVEVGITLVSKLLELGVEGLLLRVSQNNGDETVETKGMYPRKADFVAQVVEPTNTHASVFVVVVFDETESIPISKQSNEGSGLQSNPLQRPVLWSMMDLELLMSPKRAPQAWRISSVVSGCKPRMYTFVSPPGFCSARSSGLRGELGAGIALGMAGSFARRARIEAGGLLAGCWLLIP